MDERLTGRERIDEQWERINLLLGTSIVYGDESLAEALAQVADKLESLNEMVQRQGNILRFIAERKDGTTVDE